MQRTFLVAVTFLALVTGCSDSGGEVEEGEPIDGTSIVSCGDAMVDKAPPTGTFEGTLAVGDATTFAASVTLQASCPGEETETVAETEFHLSELRLVEDDAGFPGDEVYGTAGLEITHVVGCRGVAPGASARIEIPELEVVSLAALCEDASRTTSGTFPSVQVEITGEAITCSGNVEEIVLRRTVKPLCPPR
jgi:hypothetical protein